MATNAPRTSTPAPARAAAKPAAAARTAPAPPAAARRPGGRPAVRLSRKAPRAAKAPGGPEGAPAPAAGAEARVADNRAASDPRFKRAITKLNKNASELRKHDPASKKAAEAQAAAQPPPKEKLAGAQAVQVEEMQAAEGKKPEAASFLEILRDEIEKALPKNLGETDEFMDDEQKREMKAGVAGNIDDQKEAATAEIKAATQAPPDTTRVPGKEVVPMPADALPPASTTPIGAKGAMPAPKTAEEVSLQKSKDDTTRQMAEARVTTEQLNKANDPKFTAVVTAKAAVDRHADSAPKKFRADEQKTLTTAAAQAVAVEQKNMAQMKGTHGKAGANVKSRQQLAKEKDEARRKEVTDTIESIFGETKKRVEEKLASLETDVNAMFDRGVETAMEDMKKYVNRRKDAWKYERYISRVGGSVLWAKDKLFGLPDEVKVFYEEGRKLFTEDLDRLVVRIADTVEARLREAKDEISKGQKRISDYVAALPQDLQAVGKAAEKEMASRFDELRRGVDDKKQDLAQGLAQKYKEARDKADESLKSMQEEDKGLVSGFVEKLREVAEALRKFKERIMGMLKKAEDTIMLIVADPIGFLKNLLAAIKKGIGQFADNIWEHMKAGFMEWLFGALASAGLAVPKDFSLPSILKLVMDVLGITWAKIRGKVVRVIGERNVALLEAAVEAVKTVIDGGPAALWERVKEYLGNLKEMIVDAIQDWVVTSVIKAAVTKLATMFNPVGAIIQAILAIYNTVMFFIERINQILAFVEAVINSVFKIATGAVDDAANWIERSLARTIPLIIGFLARLLGLGGISEKIKGFILRVQSRVDQAIDKVIDKIIGGVKKLFAAGKAVVGKVVAWWTRKKVFTTKEGHRHTLFFRGQAQAARLMMSSEVAQSVRDRIEARRKAEPKPPADKLAALGKAEKTLEAIEALMGKRHAEAKETESIDKDIAKLLDDLAGHLAGGGIDLEALPLTKITYAMAGDRAGTVRAEPLTKNAGNTAGSPAEGSSAAPPGWAVASYANSQSFIKDAGGAVRLTSTGRPRLSRDWKRVHLVSAAFHGPAEVWNLVPGRTSLNAAFLTMFETDVKTRLGKNKELSLVVKADYPTTAEPVRITGGDDDSQVMAEAKESDFPEGFTITLKEKDAKGAMVPILDGVKIGGSGVPASGSLQDMDVTVNHIKARIEVYINGEKPGLIKTWPAYKRDNIFSKVRTKLGPQRLEELGKFYEQKVRERRGGS